MTISVGLGSGGKEQQMAMIMQILGLQEKAMASGTNLTEPPKIYNALKRLTELAGFKNADQFWSDPEDPNNPPKEPPPNPEMEKVKAQIQADQIKAQNDLQMQREKLQQEGQLQREQMAMEFQLKREQMAAELAIKREGVHLNAQVKATMNPIEMGGEVG